MKLLGIIVLLLMMGPVNVQAYTQSDWISLGSLERHNERSKDRHTGQDDTSFSDRGRLFGSFRRTAARLQEYDGLIATGDLGRAGVNWTKQPISETESSEEIKRGTRPGFPKRWAKKISVPTTSSEYLIFFTTQGCRPCLQMYPIVETLENEGYEIHVAQRQMNMKLVNQYNVSSYPTLLIFENGQVIKRLGYTTKNEILKYLKRPHSIKPDRVDYDFVDGPSYRLW